jgi:sulfofructose kinase
VSSADAAGPARRLAIVCAGIAVLDEVFRVEQFPVPHMKTQASRFMSVNGGNAANAAVVVARLGARTSFAAPIGDDANGDRLLALMTRETVDCSACPRVADVPSPISAICIDARGERAIVNFRDDRLAVARVVDPARLVAGADAVLIDNRFPEFVTPVCEAARARSIPVIIDADEPRRQSNDLIGLVSHAIFSAEGLRATTDVDDLPRALVQVRGLTSAFVAVTDGANGAYWLDGTAVRHVPAFRIDAVDTLGAGDTFHGAFALRLAEGASEADAMRFAAAAAAVKCTRFGGITVAPSRAEVDAFLSERR